MQIWRNLINSKVLNLPVFPGPASRGNLSCSTDVDISASQQAEPAQMDQINPSGLSDFKEQL